MLNKRIKSLLVAGLLVFSMSGGVFAEEISLPSTGKAVIENPKFNAEGKRVISQAILNGDIKVSLVETKDENGDYKYDIEISWNATKVNLTKVQSFYENNGGNIDHSNYFKEKDQYYCSTLVKEGDIHKFTVEGGGKDFGKLTRLVIYYEAVKGSNPVTPPTEPEKPENITDEPVAGDASIMPIAVTAVLSAAGLYVVCKKDDEE